MGRDSILPKRVFAFLHPKFNTPVINIAIVSCVSLLALVISLDNAVKFVNFGALTAFFFVNISVIAQKYIKENQRSMKHTFLYLVLPLIGAGFIGYLLSLLDRDALWMGGVWLVIGIVYHLIRKKLAPRLLAPCSLLWLYVINLSVLPVLSNNKNRANSGPFPDYRSVYLFAVCWEYKSHLFSSFVHNSHCDAGIGM